MSYKPQQTLAHRRRTCKTCLNMTEQTTLLSGWRSSLSPVHLTRWLTRAVADQRDRWFLWYPVAMMTGITAYFFLPREPHVLVFAVAAMIAIACLRGFARQQSSFRLVLIFCVLTGFVAAKARTEFVQPKLLLATTPTTQISGWVENMEVKAGGRTRLLLHVEKAEGIKPSALPDLVRLSGRRADRRFFHGDRVSVKARLFPLPTPTQPGGFDFGRVLWFQSIGATGFYYGKISKMQTDGRAGFLPKRFLQQARYHIRQRLIEALPGREGAVAVALITGDRGLMSKQDAENLRKSGLAHILAISGLHMSLVAGGVFWLVRALLAFSGPLALNYPIKKWAAMAGILAGGFYLLVSGASIATQRAFIMLLIMFAAVLIDRPAISMRNLAVAAMLIVLVRPESVLSVGFQMSFMAVVGLIAFYEFMRDRQMAGRFLLHERKTPYRWTGKGALFLLGIATTTIIASIFTGLPAAYHFNRVAVFSLAGNMFALPVVSLVVMPGAILAVLLMPLGLEFIGTEIMALGITQVLSHAETVAALPHAQLHTPALNTLASMLVAMAMIWLCLWRGGFKLVGVIPLVIGAYAITHVAKPDIIISKFGRNVAMRGASGKLVLVDGKKSRYAAEHWLVSNGDSATVKQAAARQGWHCQAGVCRATIAGQHIAYLKKGARPDNRSCANLIVIISAEPLGETCKKVKTRIDRFDLWREGAHAIYLPHGKVDGHEVAKPKVVTANAYRGKRPWVAVPVARRKILLNPGKYRRDQKRAPLPREKQRAASLDNF